MRHVKIFLRIYLSKNPFKWGSREPDTVRSAPQTGAKGKERLTENREQIEAKQGHCFIGCNLFAFLGKAQLAAEGWLSLGSDFSMRP